MPEPKTTVLEIWKPIPSTNGFYEASSLGRVRSAEKLIMIAGIVAGTIPPKILSHGSNWQTGYHNVAIRNTFGRITVENRQYTKTVHRLVAEAFFGVCPCGHSQRNHSSTCGWDVNHKNGDKHDNRPENLEYLTRGDNHRHAYRVLGRKTVPPCLAGDRHPNVKVSDAQVVEIRETYATARKLRWGAASQAIRDMAAKYRVSTSLIVQIVYKYHRKR